MKPSSLYADLDPPKVPDAHCYQKAHEAMARSDKGLCQNASCTNPADQDGEISGGLCRPCWIEEFETSHNEEVVSEP